MEGWSNWRLAWRRLERDRGFAVVAVLTLAVGIGANTAVFTLVNDVLLRPLPYPDAHQLVSIHESVPQVAQQYPLVPVDAQGFVEWQRRARALSSLALVEPDDWVMTGVGHPRQITGARVSSAIFTVLGVRPRMGRNFTEGDDQPQRNDVVIISDAFWRSQFHADPHILGRAIELDGETDTIIGVMPLDFQFPHGAEFGPILGDIASPGPIEIFKPFGLDWAHLSQGNWNYGVFARVRPGVSDERVEAELAGIANSIPIYKQMGIRQLNVVVTPLRDQIVGNHRAQLWLLLAAVAAILAIVCLNLANLLLVRVHGRSHESAIRLSLGASPARLLGETMTEGVLLALVGGALGCGLAWAGLRALVAAAPAGVPRLADVHLNGVALAFALAVSIVSGLFFSLWPAWHAATTHPEAALRAGGRGGGEAAGRARARDWLVGAQCALSAALLVVAGLLVASYADLTGVNKGFQPGHTLTLTVAWPMAKRAQRAAFYQATLEKLRALPGVRAAGITDTLPLQGASSTRFFSRPGDTRPALDRPLANWRSVSPRSFAALGIPLERGSTFTDAEMAAALNPKNKSACAAVISASTAAKLWPGRDPIGQQFVQLDPKPVYTVVGIVGDARLNHLQTPPALTIYLPWTWNVPTSVAFSLRVAGNNPMALAAAARSTVWSVQPAAAIPTIQTMDSVVAASVASRRFQMMLVLTFAFAALLLAALGIYGVVAYAVARRTHEIGIRITLGAGGGHLYGMIFRYGLTPVFAGLLIGLAGALAGGRLIASQLYGVHAADPTVLAVVVFSLLFAGGLACTLPAYRATRIDPLSALRDQT